MSAPFDLSVTDELLSTTRAVRRRLDLSRSVEREVILDCIRLSQQSPTGGNHQGWHWVVVTDPAKRAALAQIYDELGSRYLVMSAGNIDPDDHQTRRVYDSALWLKDHLAEVPVHVVPCVEGRMPESVLERLGDLAPEALPNAMWASFYASAFPAVWSFQLALRSRGLGSTLTTLHLFREPDVAEVLGIPDDMSQLALLPVAYTMGTDFKLAGRPPPESITHWNGW